MCNENTINGRPRDMGLFAKVTLKQWMVVSLITLAVLASTAIGMGSFRNINDTESYRSEVARQVEGNNRQALVNRLSDVCMRISDGSHECYRFAEETVGRWNQGD